MGLVQGDQERGVHFLDRAITRVAAVKYTESVIPAGKNQLAQIVAGLKPESRRVFKDLLCSHNVIDFNDLVKKMPELKKTLYFH